MQWVNLIVEARSRVLGMCGDGDWNAGGGDSGVDVYC